MSRLDRLSPGDLEQLSTFLDGMLAPADAAKVRARLETETELQRSLEELRQVAGAVRGLGELRVPRNFTLRAADVPQRTGTGFVYLRFATSVAAALLVLTTALRTLSGISFQLGAGAPAVQPATEVAVEMLAGAALTAMPTSTAALQAEAPFAAPAPSPTAIGTEAPTGAAAAAVPAPAATACPSCPPTEALRREAAQDLQAKTEQAAGEAAVSVAPSKAKLPDPLAVAQWAFGLSVLVLVVLTARAGRRR